MTRRGMTGPPSPRQRQVLALIGQGLSTREIAGRLKISERTAKDHVDKLRAKLGVTHKRELIPLARERKQ